MSFAAEARDDSRHHYYRGWFSTSGLQISCSVRTPFVCTKADLNATTGGSRTAVFREELNGWCGVFCVFIPENARLSGRLDETDVSIVEREATPRQLIRLSTQFYLAESSFSNIISILELFGIQRLDPPFITGFTKPMYSPNQTTARIMARSTKP
jgi:hypothetical protein